MTISTYRPKGVQPIIDAGQRIAQSIRRLGHMLAFFVEAIASIPNALRYYSKEFFRLLADVTWGNGSLVTGGGTVGVAAVLGATIGALIGIEAYNLLNIIGLGPATGFISSPGTVRPQPTQLRPSVAGTEPGRERATPLHGGITSQWPRQLRMTKRPAAAWSGASTPLLTRSR